MKAHQQEDASSGPVTPNSSIYIQLLLQPKLRVPISPKHRGTPKNTPTGIQMWPYPGVAGCQPGGLHCPAGDSACSHHLRQDGSVIVLLIVVRMPGTEARMSITLQKPSWHGVKGTTVQLWVPYLVTTRGSSPFFSHTTIWELRGHRAGEMVRPHASTQTSLSQHSPHPQGCHPESSCSPDPLVSIPPERDHFVNLEGPCPVGAAHSSPQGAILHLGQEILGKRASHVVVIPIL